MNDYVTQYRQIAINTTIQAAIAVEPWIGKGDKLAADKVATDAMRNYLNSNLWLGNVVIGEYEKDKSFGLQNGEKLGFWRQHSSFWLLQDSGVAIAVDPLEGTSQTAKGGKDAITTIAFAQNFAFTPAHYMKKLVVSKELAQKLSFTKKWQGFPELCIVWLAEAILGRQPQVCVLKRERHNGLIDDLIRYGAGVHTIPDCDIVACLNLFSYKEDKPIYDIYMGVGGAPEMIIASSFIRSLGGMAWAQDCDSQGNPLSDKVLRETDMVSQDNVFCASGVTQCSVLDGVKKHGNQYHVSSLLITPNQVQGVSTLCQPLQKLQKTSSDS